MLPRTESVESKEQARPGRWTAAILGGMALSSVAIAADGGTAAATVSATSTRSHTLYRVINLGQGQGGSVMNAKGQVAFTDLDPWGPPPQAWFYDGNDLHRIPTLGGAFINTSGLNDAGQVTGMSTTSAGPSHAYIWSKRRGTVDIGALAGTDRTTDPVINNRGEIAATAVVDPSPPYPRAVRWTAAGGIDDLGLLLPGPASSSYSRAINDAGVIAGQAWAGGSNYHAFIWTRAGGTVDIDTLGARHSDPVAIGTNGLVAGNLLNDPHNDGSVFWWTRASGMHDLGLGIGYGTGMIGMSPGGRIAGIIGQPSFEHAMTWTLHDGMRDLGTLGGIRSAAMAANNRGQVVGAAVTKSDVYHAFVWNAKEGMVDLNRRLYHPPAGLELGSALAINDSGTILAISNAGLVLLKPTKSCTCHHAVGPIAAADLVQTGAPVDTAVSFATESSAARYKVSWSWGDGTAERARDAATRNGAGNAAARHSYAAPGIYTVTASVSDQAGHQASVSRRIVVYAPGSGVAAGAGTVVVPAAIKRHGVVPGGPARFSFVAPPSMKSAAAAAAGQFSFSLPGFHFASTQARMVAAQGARVQMAGTGTINGAGRYHFTMTASSGASAGAAGRFGVKIWHNDPNTSAEVVDYDSQDATSTTGERTLVSGRIAVQ